MRTVLMLLDFVPDQQRTFETFLLRASHALRAEGWHVVFVFAGPPGDAFATELRHIGAEYRVFSFPLQPHSFEALTTALKSISPLVMTTTFISPFNPLILSLKKKMRIRFWLVHDESSGQASPRSAIKNLLAKLRGWYYGRHVDRVLAVSEFVARRNVEGVFFPSSRVRVLRNAVDLDRFHPGSDETGQSEPLVAFVGQLIPEKGARALLQAVAILKRRPTPVIPRLELAGRGALGDELRAYAAENGLDHVKFLGQVTDVPALYRAAAVVVVPSEWAEAAAFVITEAMACGACLLVSDAGGNPDLVGRDEEGGRLFRSGDAQDLAEKLLALLGDAAARARYRKQARARAERLFGLDMMVQGFVRAITEVATS